MGMRNMDHKDKWLYMKLPNHQTRNLEENKQHAYCYVIPDGLVQDVLIHVTRTYKEQTSRMSLRMKPFYGMFELLEGHERPS